MNRDEREIIDDLFAKLGEAETRSGVRDAEAEALIGQHTARQPASPYYMAQAILAQQEALTGAQARLQDLERQLAERPAGGGFLAGLFGGPPDSTPAAPANRVPGPRRASSPATAAGAGRGGRAGGGFMAGAAQTAMGVAGGMLIADMIGGLLGPDQAAAAELHDTQLPDQEPRPDDASMAGDDLADGGDFGFDDS
jgi:hypothetical protein